MSQTDIATKQTSVCGSKFVQQKPRREAGVCIGEIKRQDIRLIHYSQLIPASGSTRCRIAATQINTTSSLRRLAKRASLTNLSMTQKHIAPTMHIIRTPIKTESIATSQSLAGQELDSPSDSARSIAESERACCLQPASHCHGQ